MTVLLCACSFGGGSSGGSGDGMSQSMVSGSVVSGSSSTEENAQTTASSNESDKSQNGFEPEVPSIDGSQEEKSPEECTVEEAEAYAKSYAEFAKEAADNAVNAETADEAEKYAGLAKVYADKAEKYAEQAGTEAAKDAAQEAKNAGLVAEAAAAEKMAEAYAEQAKTAAENAANAAKAGSVEEAEKFLKEASEAAEKAGEYAGLAGTEAAKDAAQEAEKVAEEAENAFDLLKKEELFEQYIEDLIKIIEQGSNVGKEESEALEKQANETAAKAIELAQEIAQIKNEPVVEYISKVEIAVAEATIEKYAKEAVAAAENALNAGNSKEAEAYAIQAQEAAEKAAELEQQFGDNITETASYWISQAKQSAEDAAKIAEEKKTAEDAAKLADTEIAYTEGSDGSYSFSIGSLNYKVFIESEDSVKVVATGTFTGLTWARTYTKEGSQYYKTVDFGWAKYKVRAFIMDGLVKDNLQSFFENIVKDV